MAIITKEKALHRLAAYCSSGERCIADIKKKLDRWEIRPEDSRDIIARLLKEGFIDERRYCKAFINDKSKYNHWGKIRIMYELQKKGIHNDILQEALSEIDPEQTQDQLIRLLQNKQKTINGKTEFDIRQKLIRYAAGKGFSLDEIEKALCLSRP